MVELDKFKSAKYIMVIGIGGSNLASKAVYEAMTMYKENCEKKVFFLESPDERQYEEIESLLKNEIQKKEDFSLIAISKSGKTRETLEAFRKTFDILKNKFSPEEVNERSLVISTKETPLSNIAEKNNIDILEWENGVGGRFSAFSIAHTAVLEIAGLDVEGFKSGNRGEEGTNKDRALEFAKKVYRGHEAGLEILDIFIFNSELETLGKWCRQLLAESLASITPTISIGPTDLHSMLELYLEKPKSRFTLFIKSQKEMSGSINDEAYTNTTREYSKRDMPFYEYSMLEISEKEIGEFMAFMIASVLELGKLLGVDPYDQPEVDKYKSGMQGVS
ncbi:MAG: hypothetical protein AAB392_01080 [Patescibacteria group bacterium]